MKNWIVILAFALVMGGCAGRDANPVMAQQWGDDEKSCKSLRSEMRYIETEIATLMPKTNKTGKNVALGITGYFLIVPWFFMDLSDAEKQEVRAYQTRYNHLMRIAEDKFCTRQIEATQDAAD